MNARVCRTCVFQVLYMLLVVVFHSVAIHDGLYVVLLADPHGNHLCSVFILLFTNLILYIVCCHSNPGELVSDGPLLKQALAVYVYDGQMYKQGVVCSTCNIVKPARSKHCRKCSLVHVIVNVILLLFINNNIHMKLLMYKQGVTLSNLNTTVSVHWSVLY